MINHFEHSPTHDCGVGLRRLPRGFLIVLLFVLPASFGSALTFSAIDIRAGIPWLGVAGQGQVVAPSPFMYEWGVSTPFQLKSPFSFVPEIDFFGTQYQLTSDGVRAIPTEVEYRSSVWMLGVLIDPSFRYTLQISKPLWWGVTASPAVILHIPTRSWDLSSQQIGAVTSYLYAKARFLFPSVGTFFRYQLMPTIALEVRVRSFLPIFHLWDGEGLPFYDQLMIDGSLGVRISLGKQR